MKNSTKKLVFGYTIIGGKKKEYSLNKTISNQLEPGDRHGKDTIKKQIYKHPLLG